MSQTDLKTDQRFMRMALRLARRGLGRVAPNPAVGCLLVNQGRIVGRGWTQPGGRPHAETVALERAGPLAKGATAYVTLEPCSHHGKTPPCCDALIKAGISRVVSALQDPDERVNGRGLEILREAGVEVVEKICESEALDANIGFVESKTIDKPLVTLKMATSLDGKIATTTGSSQWITGPQARRYGHMLRAKNDAIMVGIGTVLADDPELSCRIPGLTEYSPIRIVADTRLRIPLTSQLFKTVRDIPLWIVTVAGNDPERIDAIRNLGADVIEVEATESGLPDLKHTLSILSDKGITRLLVEGGSHLQASLIKEELADRLMWFRAAKVIGGDGISVFQSIGLKNVSDAPILELEGTHRLGEDQLERYFLRN
ncbi:bifunctional diaminohydroxyphosphoribosylaminopyrimidine deaminase/5-amino-6-(5-phosphoribosylamino)uracil reductase RibD [Sneathiella aquimaris]|uniref:bifunctional diaminohydroxyphosphoribosylaminopyrimidine deaminase/5-amino-6-(5-phosphoribosylamino)uracil reductase RibD n=1 Tax=Sneathiella aquimaris TaxID=2599305 RepID=UPI001CA56EB4|nr:bifunctional diaminohydroxyphosphoribosylaminopyrimidine deaminase/5-amino-6-(5-phosphoribosylamino)uracil reductase RibD [Sneathiella aquimaris]